MSGRGRGIWLDDERGEPVGWERAKTARECITLLAQGGVDVVSLDHDLGEADGGTGYTAALWIEEQAAEGRWNLVPAALMCHSLNPAGKARIRACFARIVGMRVEDEARSP